MVTSAHPCAGIPAEAARGAESARRAVPESIAYDRMTGLFQAVARRQQADLDTLEEEPCALSARVDALEAAG